MVKQAATGATSTGTCSFCKEEIDKRKMTQHLKYCKQRAAAITAGQKSAPEQKTRLFHLLVEGRYNPQYWMHLEVPASEPLETLDRFLRDIWLECCGHLSAFRIDGTSYDAEPEDYYFPDDSFFAEGEEEAEEEVESEPDEDEGDGLIHMEEVLSDVPPQVVEAIPPDWLAEVKKPWPVDDLIAFAKSGLKSISERPYPQTLEERKAYNGRYYQRFLLKWLLDMLEDRTMGVKLEKVLSVGQKFSHEYDFGSTTHLNLRVVSEREGVVRDEDDPVEVLARNNAPAIRCMVCGKRATQLAAGYFHVEENAYCDECARKRGEDEMLLPIVNSPRVGVCGYTGDAGYIVLGEEEDFEDEDEDEEYLDEDDENEEQ